MAGSYPDVPGYRFAYDLDGTAMSYADGTVFSTTMLRNLNNDATNSNITAANSTAIIFPEIRTITGIFVQHNTSSNCQVSSSQDTTTGFDGTWDSHPNITMSLSGERLASRTGIIPLVLNDIKSLKINAGSGSWRRIALYGHITPTQSPDRLRIVDMSSDSTTSNTAITSGKDVDSYLDFGNISQRSSATKQFKIINNSSLLTATNITISLDIVSAATPSLLGQYQVSTDNISFANAVNIGNLSPNQASASLYIRANPASNAQLGPWSVRIIAHPVSWS